VITSTTWWGESESVAHKMPGNKLFQDSIIANSIPQMEINSIHLTGRHSSTQGGPQRIGIGSSLVAFSLNIFIYVICTHTHISWIRHEHTYIYINRMCDDLS